MSGASLGLRSGNRGRSIALAALILAGLVPLVWPGDIPFINDEPQLIASAVNANQDHRLAAMGLLGTFGLFYGPAPTWVYQVLVLPAAIWSSSRHCTSC